MTLDHRQRIISLIKKEVVPALGCTEPIAVALAVAKARETLDCTAQNISVWVSPNIYKNGMGVGIPGTGLVGLHIAAALGAICGHSSDQLEVLKSVNSNLVLQAQKMVESGQVQIYLEDTCEKLYIRATCGCEPDSASAIIRGMHNNITQVILNDSILEDVAYQAESTSNGTTDFDVTMEEIFEFSTTAPEEELHFLLEGARMNQALSEYGLQHTSGLGVGSRIAKAITEGRLGSDLLNRAMSETAAASDARMSGAMLPAMSNSGSGNQGITAMVPVVSVARILNSSEEQLCRALAISNLTVIHIKKSFGRLSAACGCVVASTGAACGTAYLLGGNLDTICAAIKNMVGNLTGMVCDGAKLGCALKVSTGTSAAIQSALLAIDKVCVSSNDGIIEDDIEKTIRNIGVIASESMDETDKTILSIMRNK